MLECLHGSLVNFLTSSFFIFLGSGLTRLEGELARRPLVPLLTSGRSTLMGRAAAAAAASDFGLLSWGEMELVLCNASINKKWMILRRVDVDIMAIYRYVIFCSLEGGPYLPITIDLYLLYTIYTTYTEKKKASELFLPSSPANDYAWHVDNIYQDLSSFFVGVKRHNSCLDTSRKAAAAS